MKPASEGQEFGLESMQAASAGGSSSSCPVTLIFRYQPYPATPKRSIPCLSELHKIPGTSLKMSNERFVFSCWNPSMSESRHRQCIASCNITKMHEQSSLDVGIGPTCQIPSIAKKITSDQSHVCFSNHGISDGRSLGEESSLQYKIAGLISKANAGTPCDVYCNKAVACMCRPAVMEAMKDVDGGESAQPKPVTNAGRQYYFVSIKVDAETGITSAAERAPFVGLQIGLLLGKGAYGCVYKGYYHGKIVAVKVAPFCPSTHRHPVLRANFVLQKQHPLGVFMSGYGCQGQEVKQQTGVHREMSYRNACKTESGEL